MEKKEIVIKIEEREKKGKKIAKKLQKKGKIAGVFYGNDFKSTSISVDKNVFEKFKKESTGSQILSLLMPNGKKEKAIVQDLLIDPIRGDVMHIDFLRIDMKRKVEVYATIKFTGESKAIKEKGAVLVKNMDKIKVSCLPISIPEYVEINLDKLENIDDHVLVEDIKSIEGVTILEKPDEAVAVATVQKVVEKEEKPSTEEEKTEENVDSKEEEKKEGEEKSEK